MKNILALVSITLLGMGCSGEIQRNFFPDQACSVFKGEQHDAGNSESVEVLLCRDGKDLDGKFTVRNDSGKELIVSDIDGKIFSEHPSLVSNGLEKNIYFYDSEFIAQDVPGYQLTDYYGWIDDGQLFVQSDNSSVVATKHIDMLVDFEDDVSLSEIEELEDELQVGIVSELNFKPNSVLFSNTKIATLSVPCYNYDAIAEKLSDYGNLESVEVNSIFKVTYPSTDFLYDDNSLRALDGPNDPLYSKQWHLTSIGMEDAWKEASGEGVVVAVIDTGVSDGKGKFARVPDLKQTEILPGYNFVENNSDPSDGNGHGTHVAGTIAQSTNNNIGTAGIAPKAKILPVKVLSDRGWGTLGSIVAGIRYAADNGANVINLSLGGGGYSKAMDKAVEYAHKKNVMLACAAGNGGKAVIEYPAAYEHCLAVSATDKNSELTFYSSYGEGKNGTSLFISAPGGDTRVSPEGGVWQNTIARGDPTKHGYFPFQGTSMATPHVAGVGALVIEQLGADDYDVEDVEDILSETATAKSDPYKYGSGALDARAAVVEAKNHSDFGFMAGMLMFLLSIGISVLIRTTK